MIRTVQQNHKKKCTVIIYNEKQKQIFNTLKRIIKKARELTKATGLLCESEQWREKVLLNAAQKFYTRIIDIERPNKMPENMIM